MLFKPWGRYQWVICRVPVPNTHDPAIQGLENLICRPISFGAGTQSPAQWDIFPIHLIVSWNKANCTCQKTWEGLGMALTRAKGWARVQRTHGPNHYGS